MCGGRIILQHIRKEGSTKIFDAFIIVIIFHFLILTSKNNYSQNFYF